MTTLLCVHECPALRSPLALCAFLLAACDDRGSGSLTVSLSGEEAAREGYPVGEGEDEIAFADGYEVQFERVLVALEAFELHGADGEEAMLDADPVVADLHRGEPEAWHFEGVPARRWSDVRFQIAPARGDSRTLEGVDEDNLSAMVEAGYALWIEGFAEDADGMTYPFSLGFDFRVHNRGCVSGRDDTDGLVVPESARGEVELTLHFDHLFLDSYAGDEAALRFEPWAATIAEAEAKAITLETLAEQSLADLRDRRGGPLRDAAGRLLVYDPGPLPIEGTDLGAYVTAAAMTIGHFNGEGHCVYELEPQD